MKDTPSVHRPDRDVAAAAVEVVSLGPFSTATVLWQSAGSEGMLSVVAKSKARFGEPWGMITLFWSAGSPAGATGRSQAGAWSVAKP